MNDRQEILVEYLAREIADQKRTILNQAGDIRKFKAEIAMLRNQVVLLKNKYEPDLDAIPELPTGSSIGIYT